VISGELLPRPAEFRKVLHEWDTCSALISPFALVTSICPSQWYLFGLEEVLRVFLKSFCSSFEIPNLLYQPFRPDAVMPPTRHSTCKVRALACDFKSGEEAASVVNERLLPLPDGNKNSRLLSARFQSIAPFSK
jgi:hypothetical protein